MVYVKMPSTLRGAALLLATASAATAAPDLDRSVSLRADWQYLTRDIADPAQWSHSGKRFHYRKTVEGGFAFVEVFACSLSRRDPFDHTKIASALSAATNNTYEATTLPFTTFSYTANNTAISVSAGSSYTCSIGENGEAGTYECVPPPARQGNRPRGFGVVRDPNVPANNAPRRSPDGTWEALVQNDNVVVRPSGGSNGTATPLSTDGTAENYYDAESIVWSPDSKKLVAYRVTPGYPREVVRVEAAPTTQKQPIVRRQLYPKPGDEIDQDQPVLFHVDGSQSIEVSDELFPTAYQISRPVWRRDSSEFTFDYQRRGHSQARVIAVSGETGTARAVVTEDADEDSFVYADRRYRYDVGDGSEEMLWISERDGWRHLYLVSTADATLSQITKGDWLVRDVLRVDVQKRLIWFVANGVDEGKDPYFRHLFTVKFDGSDLTRLTTTDANHDISISPDASHYVDTYSRVDLPTVSELRNANGSLVAILETGDITELTAAGFKTPEIFVAKGRDGTTDIWGLIIRPTDFDPSKKYRVIENIYAGPHDSFVPKTFWPFGFHSGGDKVIGMQAQADLGFIVVQMDGMGTANRNKAFHDIAWKDLADSGFPDRMLWHQAAAAKYPDNYDLDGGVGIYGASAGGQSSLNALLFHGDFYQFAVAYAGCYDNRMDKISWNEQWLGWPVDESYSAASGVDHAEKLEGQILLINGEQDSNVDPASTMQVVDALVTNDKDFELLIVPGADHAVGRSVEPIDYVQRRQMDFFVRKMLNGTAGVM